MTERRCRGPINIGGVGNSTNTEKWNNFFNRLSENIEVKTHRKLDLRITDMWQVPDLIWDENMRQELIFCINEEIQAYDKEKVKFLIIFSKFSSKILWNVKSRILYMYNHLVVDLLMYC